MRFFYTAPHLFSEIGHSANYCRAIRKELLARDIEAIFLASRHVTNELQRELDAIPFFSMSSAWDSDGDPVSGWLNAFDRGTRVTAADFTRLTDIRGDDIVYLNAVWPAQVMGLGTWLRDLQSGAAPAAIVEFVVGPGVALRESAEGISLGIPDPRNDGRAVLYRHVAHKLREAELTKFSFATLDTRCSTIYAELLQSNVHTLPWPFDAAETPRHRGNGTGVTLATLGYQRPKKGYHLMPEVFASLLRDNPALRILAHNSMPQEMPETQNALRALAQSNPALELSEAAVTAAVWNSLMDAADLIVCPYHPGPYSDSHSAIVAEAIAGGIPLVVPANTVLSAHIEKSGARGVTFAEYSAKAIERAVQTALDGFEELAVNAHAAAVRWRETQGPGHFVDAILRLAAQDKIAGH